MKASIVYNKNEEPRILLELELFEERNLLENVTKLCLVREGYDTMGGLEVLTDVAFEIEKEINNDNDY